MSAQNWRRFVNTLKWNDGEHIAIFGPTGSGKTTLLLELLKNRDTVVLLLNKVKDSTSSRFIEQQDYTLYRNWEETSPYDDKIALWPPFYNKASFKTQEDVFDTAINGRGKVKGIFQQGNWTVAIDEVLYFVDQLDLRDDLNLLWSQGRSNGISVIAGSQRPFYVPQLMLSSWTHLFAFEPTNEYDTQKIVNTAGKPSKELARILPELKEYEFAYANRKSREVVVSKVTR